MKRSLAIFLAASAGALLASGPASAAEEVNAKRILDSIYSSLGIEKSASEVETSRNGFFVGVHSGLGTESGIAPAAAGMAIPLDTDEQAQSITANGYYVYTPGWSIGTYLGGGVGKVNLNEDLLLNTRSTLAYQGMAGVTFSFTPSMVLGLEYRYAEPLQDNTAAKNDPANAEDQSVTLRFDFLLN